MDTSPRWLIVVFSFLMLVLLAGGVWFYQGQEERLRQEAEANLDAIARLKVDEIVAWRAERFGDGAVCMDSPFFVAAVMQWMARPEADVSEQLLARFRSMQKNYGYSDVLLVDAGGKVRLSLSGRSGPLHEDAVQAMVEAFRERRPVFTDLHVGPGDLPSHLDVVAPLFTQNSVAPKPVGAIILQSEARRFLYPLVQTWPTPSRTAETLLVRRDGETVLFLNELRHRRDTALKLRIPLSEKDVPAVRAVLGKEGVMQGKDYRGVDVLSVLKAVPDSRWFIVAKMDTGEAFSVLRRESALIVSLLLGLAAATAAAVGMVWQRNAKTHYQTLLQAEKAQRESEERHRITLMSVGDGVITTDAEGRVGLLNPVAEALTGWRQEEACGKPLEQLFCIFNEETREPVENPVRRVMREGLVVGLANHTVLMRKDGVERPIADSGAPIRDENGVITGVVLVFRDQTEERRYSKEREGTVELLRLLSGQSGKHELIQAVTGFLKEWSGCEAVGVRLREGDDFPYFETRGFPSEFVRLENSLCARDSSGQLVRDGEGNPFLECMCGNIICGRFNPALPFFSAKGSFWANSTTRLLATTTEADRQSRTRNRCNGEGYESVALIRLRSGDETFGLLQLNDHAAGRFTPESIAFMENVADQIAISLAQRKGQDALRESEEKYRHLVECLGGEYFLYHHDANGVFTYLSPSITNVLGYSGEEFLAHFSTYLTDHPINLEVKKHTALSIQGIQQPTYEVEIRHRNGSSHWLEVTETPIFGNDGKVEGVEGIAHDITLRKQAEDVLRESEERFRGTLDTMMEGCQIIGFNWRYLYLNEVAARHGRRPREDTVGRTMMDVYPGIETTEMFATLKRCMESRVPEQMENEFIYPDGVKGWFEISIQPTRAGIFILSLDISERKRAEAEQEKLQAQLVQAQKMESVGRLAGGVAHDFNNMLTAILGYADLELTRGLPDSPLYNSLMEIQKAAQRSADLTRQLLAFARKQTVSPKVLDLNDAVSGMLRMLRRLIGEDIDLAWMPGHGLWKAKIDPSQLDQILANLTVNARDAIAGVGKVTIETGNEVFDETYCFDHIGFVPGEYVRLAVSDDGMGMNKDVLEHLFEPFFTTKGTGKGTGLGLATVYGIVKQNDGFINVYSEPGHGTTFKVYLPRFAAEPVEVAEERPEAAPQGGTETVLLVEDEEAILKLGEVILEGLGYTVLTAGSPALAIRLAGEFPGDIHLLITDVVMPEMNGRELAEQLSYIKPGLKCLYMSGYTANVIAHRGVLEEGVHFVHKPFSVETLAAKARKALEG
ncbi:PAS domain S-box protein [Candidatus Poribacteria bacterium]|nr:PAS domain S-box protein [Candidatus Poribacteria bacterium]